MMTQKLRKSFISNFKHCSKLDLHLSDRNPPVSQNYDGNLRHFQVYMRIGRSHRGISLLTKKKIFTVIYLNMPDMACLEIINLRKLRNEK